jgi:hypothetical protein
MSVPHFTLDREVLHQIQEQVPARQRAYVQATYFAYQHLTDGKPYAPRPGAQTLSHETGLCYPVSLRAMRTLVEMGVIPPYITRINPLSTRKAFIPDRLRWEVWERDNFTCLHCGNRRFLTVDHIIPESRGGTLDLDNLQTLCKPCNSRKGVRYEQ